ncbi:MAG: choline/ethanolamine kinase family protein [Oceanicoccus sp.]
MNNRVDQQETYLRKHLADYCLPWCDHNVSLIRALSGGLTNRSYLLQSQGARYVLRINAANSLQLDLDRRAEIEILQVAGKKGIATEFVYADPAGSFLVTRFVDGDLWQREWSYSSDNIFRIAALLKSIHRLEGVSRVMNIRNKSERYWQVVDTDKKLTEKLRAVKQKVEAYIGLAESKNRNSCLCHNDLLAENIMVAADDKLVAIDWEYAAMGDPYFDLAVVVEGHRLNSFLEKKLLSDYLGNEPSTAEISRLQCCRIEYVYLEILWYAVQFSSSRALMFGQIVEEKITYLDRQLNAFDTLEMIAPMERK